MSAENLDFLRGIISETAEIAGYIFGKGWAEGSAGNISVNLDTVSENELSALSLSDIIVLEKPYPTLAGKLFLISGSGRRMRDIATKPYENLSIIRIGLSGNNYELLLLQDINNYYFLPTSELPAHLAVHSEISSKGYTGHAIIHCHVSELIALTQNPKYKKTEELNSLLFGVHPEMSMFLKKGVGVIPFNLPGSQGSAAATIETLFDYDLLVWEKHGVMAIGESPSKVFDIIEIVAKAASVFFLCKAANYEPEGLTDYQLNKLRSINLK